jgi:hypothetical protein
MSERKPALSQRDALNLYVRRVQQRLRLETSLRGAAAVAVAALAATIVLVLILNAYALTPARLVLLVVLLVVVCFGLAWPLWRLTRGRAVGRAEAVFPEFQERLTTFSEKEKTEEAGGIFQELLAADTLKIADEARPEGLVPRARLLAMMGAALVCTGVLVWMVAARPS